MHQGHHLHVDQAAHLVGGGSNRPQMHEVRIAVSDVHMGSHVGHSGEQQSLEGGDAAFGHLVESEHAARRGVDPGIDGTHQIATRIGNLVGGQGLVEVRMRFDERRQEEPTAEVGHVVARLGVDLSADGDDRPPLVDHHVDPLSGAITSVAQDPTSHLVILPSIEPAIDPDGGPGRSPRVDHARLAP